MSYLEPLRVKRLTNTASIPKRSTLYSSGLDLFADLGGNGNVVELSIVPTLISTGLALEIPKGFEVQIRPRSGLSREGVDVAFGTVDADYRGELKVNMALHGDQGKVIQIHHGDRIAQLVVAPVSLVDVEEVDELGKTTRGTGGFGSTGR